MKWRGSRWTQHESARSGGTAKHPRNSFTAEVREAWVCAFSLLAGAMNVQAAALLVADHERNVLKHEVTHGQD